MIGKKSRAASLRELAEEMNFAADLPDYERIEQEQEILEQAEREELEKLMTLSSADKWAMDCVERDIKRLPDDEMKYGV